MFIRYSGGSHLDPFHPPATFAITPQLVPDCANKWFGIDAAGTEAKSRLNTPYESAIAALIGSCVDDIYT